MTRIVLFAAILALGAGAATLPTASAHAQEKKGFFGLFNRQSDDSGDSGGPIHMTPGTQGAAAGSESKAYGFGKSGNKNTARYEDSPINAEAARQASNFDKWNSNELASANASTQALIAQMKAEQEYNAQAARQQQAQKIAQIGQAMSAGPAPAGANPSVVQAMRAGSHAQALSSMQGVVGMAPPAAKASPVASEAPVAEKPKREPRSQGLFNRVTD